jgi:histidinol dehydrogenase
MMIPIYLWKSPECEVYLKRIASRGSESYPDVEAHVAAILSAVKEKGDIAVQQFTLQFDGVVLQNLKIDPVEIESLASLVDPQLRQIFRRAKKSIWEFHEHQLESSWEYKDDDGVCLGQRINPLQSAGLYVPGGKAAYPSSLLMNAIPAQIAGVPRIVVTTPYPQFRQNPGIAAVLVELGLTEVYGIGGAQAIAALAFGTATIPRVDKIVGPGNLYVALAKRQVFGTVDIDMIAGPSEVVVVADSSTDPAFVAADLMAQAEHDERACSIAVTNSDDYALCIRENLNRLLAQLKRADIIQKALEAHGAVLVVRDWEDAAEAVNMIAPEHLELLIPQADEFSKKIHAAGAIFFGGYSCEAVGDYFAGPNHVLPTSGTARFASPLGVYDFVKRSSVIKYTREALLRNHQFIEHFALMEQLDAHALSIRLRVKGEAGGSSGTK